LKQLILHVSINLNIHKIFLCILLDLDFIRNELIKVEQLKIYLLDTFDIGFGYPEYQPWTIEDLENRLESIFELLLPSITDLVTTEDICKELISIDSTLPPVPSIEIFIHQDIFEKASNAFYEAKKRFLKFNQDQYSWSDGTCTWLNNVSDITNERQHHDILTYHTWNRNTLQSCSVIIICLANVSDGGNIITLSIGSPMYGKMNRIPIGQYSKAQNYTIEFQDKFITELKYLLISIWKHRKASQQ
jgi:hypothetical protein